MGRITDKYIFFYKSKLANWHPCEFDYNCHHFYNTEQAFMWEKAIFFGDFEIAEKILNTKSPAEAKNLGRKVKNYDDDSWNEVRYSIMVNVNYAKFSQIENEKELLLSTENKILVEASPIDKIWGIGLHWSNDDCLDENKWLGRNLLGKALMEVREMIKNKIT